MVPLGMAAARAGGLDAPSTKAVIFIGSGKISFGKLSQALDHGALTLQIAGDFDDAMRRVQEE